MGLTTTPIGGGGVTGSGSMTGGGVVATAGFTLTVPATGTAALLGTANTFTQVQTLPNGTAGAPSLNFGDATSGLYRSAADRVAIATAGAVRMDVGVVSGAGTCTLYTPSGTSVYLGAGGAAVAQLGSASNAASLCGYWNASAITGGLSSTNRAYPFSLGGDVTLQGDAADVLALRRSTSAQAFRLYGTYTDASNYVRLGLNTTSTTLTIAAETAGTGADDIDLAFTPAGTGTMKFGTHSAVAAETVTGYITIKDSGGTTRKLAVIS